MSEIFQHQMWKGKITSSLTEALNFLVWNEDDEAERHKKDFRGILIIFEMRATTTSMVEMHDDSSNPTAWSFKRDSLTDASSESSKTALIFNAIFQSKIPLVEEAAINNLVRLFLSPPLFFARFDGWNVLTTHSELWKSRNWKFYIGGSQDNLSKNDVPFRKVW